MSMQDLRWHYEITKWEGDIRRELVAGTFAGREIYINLCEEEIILSATEAANLGHWLLAVAAQLPKMTEAYAVARADKTSEA